MNDSGLLQRLLRIETKHLNNIPGIDNNIQDYDWEIESLQIHSEYVYPFFVALYLLAKKGGILVTSQFIWLRYADRTLFYALHQAARLPEGSYLFDSKWVEAAAIECHFIAEETLKESIKEPRVQLSVDGLEKALVKDKVIFL